MLFYVNGSKEKNGIVPIMGRVTINGSVAQFSCKLTIAKTMWDAKGNRAKGKKKKYIKHNNTKKTFDFFVKRFFVGGLDETRTRDPMRDRHVF